MEGTPVWVVVWRGVLVCVAAYTVYLAALTPSIVDQVFVGLLLGACVQQFVEALRGDG